MACYLKYPLYHDGPLFIFHHRYGVPSTPGPRRFSLALRESRQRGFFNTASTSPSFCIPAMPTEHATLLPAGPQLPLTPGVSVFTRMRPCSCNLLQLGVTQKASSWTCWHLSFQFELGMRLCGVSQATGAGNHCRGSPVGGIQDGCWVLVGDIPQVSRAADTSGKIQRVLRLLFFACYTKRNGSIIIGHKVAVSYLAVENIQKPT